MFARSILIPSLIVCAIAAPLLLTQSESDSPPVDSPELVAQQAGFSSAGNARLPTAQINGGQASNPMMQVSSANVQTAPNVNGQFLLANSRGNPATPGAAGMNPILGTGQTVILPGDANGPDLDAAPLEFMPVTNFEEVFRFDVTPNWVTSRWPRISTCPGDVGLHGLRVALVTGTSSWDLHGSLTYYFDENQRAQRITFRGWAGNATKLTSLLTKQFEFQPKPTQWAGFYLAEKRRQQTGGMLMKHPAVIYANNPIQQIAVVLEINNPQSDFVLSNEFQSMIAGSKTQSSPPN